MVYAMNVYKVRDYIQINTYISKLYSDGNIYIYNEAGYAGLSTDQSGPSQGTPGLPCIPEHYV